MATSKMNQKQSSGRFLLLLERDQKTDSSIKQLNELYGIKAKSSKDFENEIVTASDFDNNDGIVFDNISVAIISAKAAKPIAVNAYMNHPSSILKPEPMVHSFGMDTEEIKNYMEGYRDATNAMTSMVLDEENHINEEEYYETEAIDAAAANETWSLKAKRVIPTIFFTSFSGLGAKLMNWADVLIQTILTLVGT